MATDVQLRLLISAVDRAGRSLQQIGDRLRGIGTAADSANKRTGAGARQATSAVEGLNRALEKTKAKLEAAGKAGDKMAQVGTRLAAAGAALGVGAFFPIKEAATFERAMARVEAVTTETEVTFDDLSKKARELGRTTAFTAEEAASGMRFLGMAGLETNEVFEAITPTLNLAAAGELELGEAADIATNIMSAFGKETTDLVDIMDVLAQTAANSNTDVRQLAEAISYAGPTAKAAGVSFEETAARLGVLASNGIKASRAGTNLRGIIASLVKPSTEALNTFDKLGVEISKNADGSLNLAKIFNDLEKAGLGAEEAFAIFRRTAGGAGVVFTEQSQRLKDLQDKIDNATGAAEKMRKTMEDNLVGAFTILKSALSGLLIVLGGPLQESLESIALSVAKLTTSLANWIEKHPTLSKVIVGTTGVLALLLAGIGAILIPLGLIVSGFASGAAAIVSFAGFITTTAIPAFVGLKAAIVSTAATLAPMVPLLAALAAAWGIVKIYEAVNAFIDMRRAILDMNAAMDKSIAYARGLKQKFAEFKDVKIEGAVSDQTFEELKDFETSLKKQRAHLVAARTEAFAESKKKTWLFFTSEQAEEAANKLSLLDAQIKGNSEIRKRVTEELKAKEKELGDAVRNSADKQIDAKKEISETDRKRLEQVEKIALATRSLELGATDESAEKIAAQRKLDLDRFEQSEENKTLAAAKATEERAKRIAAINAVYDKRLDDLKESQVQKEAQRMEQLQGLEEQFLQLQGQGQLSALEGQYDAGLINLEEYMGERRAIVERETELQLRALRQQLAGADVQEAPALELEIKIAEEEEAAKLQNLLDLQDRYAQERLAREQSLKDGLRQIEMRSLDEFDLETKYALDLEALDQRNAAELLRLEELGASRAELLDAQAQQDISRAQLVANQEKAILDQRISAASGAVDNIAEVMTQLYGKQSKAAKAAFIAQKGIAIAQTIMSTYEAAQKAFSAMSGIPYVGPVLGAVAAAAAIAAGLARVAQIRSQTAATGGEIEGHSPHKRADNIPIWGTAGEFMQPVDAVQYYGKPFMEAIRRKLIPKDQFAGFRIPAYARPAVKRNFQSGGGVPSRGEIAGTRGAQGREIPTPTEESKQQEIKIMNFVDQREMLGALGTPDGEDVVLNVISKNRDKVSRVLR